MPRLLEDLDHGTPVLSIQEGTIGEVRGVFASGETRVPQYLLVYWNDTREETLLDTNEVLTISDEGVKLRSQRKTYAGLTAFDTENNPLIHRLK
ncbi:MAG TPA: hypothetical protein VGR69_09475 [Candidatus Rubrimentiphilum sp.]|nr:hypothetical protein [Candidatus Rubrimentiphilum sp.]